jgi:hypothetical protein
MGTRVQRTVVPFFGGFMEDPDWEYDAVSVVGNAEVVQAFAMVRR